MTWIGVDVGATLAKLAICEAEDTPALEARLDLLPAQALGLILARIREARPNRVTLTGGAAGLLSEHLQCDTARVDEFAAWGAGAGLLLEGSELDDGQPYLLVSLGTGTSVLRAAPAGGEAVTRLGGTALGGGTIMGLGAALVGSRDFDELSRMAAKGSRREVDLLVSDIGEVPLRGDMTASAFGKLARIDSEHWAPEDLAAGIMGLVGENVALICAGLASAAGLQRVVFGGSALRGNSALADVVRGVTVALGRNTTLLAGGEFAGALGALELARSQP